LQHVLCCPYHLSFGVLKQFGEQRQRASSSNFRVLFQYCRSDGEVTASPGALKHSFGGAWGELVLNERACFATLIANERF
jgi:hypothetical protein